MTSFFFSPFFPNTTITTKKRQKPPRWQCHFLTSNTAEDVNVSQSSWTFSCACVSLCVWDWKDGGVALCMCVHVCVCHFPPTHLASSVNCAVIQSTESWNTHIRRKNVAYVSTFAKRKSNVQFLFAREQEKRKRKKFFFLLFLTHTAHRAVDRRGRSGSIICLIFFLQFSI